jgi:large subunit ribosomal protein L32e
MKNRKFIRRNWSKASRLGKKRKTKQVWRSAKGRHNKVREKRKGYPIKVMIGFKQEKKGRNLIEKQKPVLVSNAKELEQIKKGEIAIIGKIGNRKRIELAKKAKEKGIPVYNINVNKMLKKIEKKKKAKTQDKKENKPKEKKQ